MKLQAKKWVETNRRPARPLDTGRNFGRVWCAPPFLSAAVAHPFRSTAGRAMGTFPFLLLLAAMGCGSSVGTPVHFTVPDGYRGTFYLILDSKNGVAVAEKSHRYTVVIPASGRLRVRNFRFLQSWHHETASYASGARIPTETDPSASGELAPDVVGVRGGSTIRRDGVEFVWYVIGNQQDLDAKRNLQP